MKPGQIRILVVDGDQANADKTVQILNPKGYHIDAAYSMQEGLDKSEKVEKLGYHLFIVDIDSSGQPSGMETVRQLRENHRHTCVIILTSTPTLETAIQAVQFGVCDYISKPVTEERLIEGISKSLLRVGIYLTSEETIIKSIGTKLRFLRKEQGLTTQQLANRVGVTQSQISQVETGRSAASVVTLYKIAQAFDTSLSEMLEGA